MSEKVKFTDKSGNEKVMAEKHAKVLMQLGRGTYATRDMQALPTGSVPSAIPPVRVQTQAPAPMAPLTEPVVAPAPAPVAPPVAPAPAPVAPPADVAPAARELLEAAGINPSTVKGTGVNGRILKADAEAAIANLK